MHACLAVFAKTIGLSPVKTRLVTALGQAKAEAFYRLSVATMQALAQQAEHDLDIVPYWALGEQQATTLPQWQAFNRLWTGDGNLGQRLSHVYAQLNAKYQVVILMGSDSPQLSCAYIYTALQTLAAHPHACIIGPAEDGGFCLLAAQRPIHHDIWCNIVYSQNDTLQQLKQRLAKYTIPVVEIATQQDVDTLADLHTLQHKLRTHTHMLPQQQALLDWLNTQLV